MGKGRNIFRRNRGGLLVAALLALAPVAASAFDFALVTPGAPKELRRAISAASLTAQASRDKTDAALDVFTAARGDYGAILRALYAAGYYSGIITIRIDGHEAAAIAPLDAPAHINRVEITVDPGPRFTLSRAAIGPLAPKTVLPEGFRPGAPAFSGTLRDAADAGIEGWRQVGHAKAAVAGQDLVADHRAATLSADIALDPGPQLRLGTLRMQGNDRLRTARLAKIAGFPTGEVFDPDTIDTVAKRLRRTGIFSSVTLTEADKIGPDGTLDVDLVVVEQKPRRLGFGAEASSTDGLRLNGYWLHRNLLGGGERLRLDADITGIGAQNGGADYALGARIDRPATLSPDTSGWLETRLERQQGEDFDSNLARFGLGFDHVFSDRLTGSIGLSYLATREIDAAGTTDFRLAELPVKATWDNRDTPLDATRGIYLDATAMPFLGFGSTGSGLRLSADARGYRALGSRAVLAGRVQLGTVLGPDLVETPRDYQFFSGGGGTVRGQPYQSLAFLVPRNSTLVRFGGLSFAAASTEARVNVTDSIGAVAFADAGWISTEGGFGGLSDWHAGAGLGLRYDTGIGPIRLDVAKPVHGTTGSGVQVYLGIGQAF